ncbi:MAG: hypothetical protein ACREEK_12670 [Bradyrhizobium sp.]
MSGQSAACELIFGMNEAKRRAEEFLRAAFWGRRANATGIFRHMAKRSIETKVFVSRLRFIIEMPNAKSFVEVPVHAAQPGISG